MPGFPESVLVVDDDPMMTELMEIALRRVGDILITTCNDYGEAMLSLNNDIPALILLDLRMPNKDGTDIVRSLREDARFTDIPVIFVTGEDRVEMCETYGKLGVVGVIHKPFKPTELVMGVQKLWQAHKYKAEE